MVASAAVVVIGIVVGVVCIVSSLAYVGSIGANHTKGPGDLPNPYVNRAYGFTVQYPAGWKGYENYRLDANHTSAVTFFGTNASISVSAQQIPSGQTFDQIDAASAQADMGSHKGYSMFLQSEGTGTLSGVSAHVRIWIKKTQQGQYEEETFHLLHLGRIYTIGFITPASEYDNQVGQFNQFIRTFSFI